MINLIQKKILKLLSINARYSNKDIAKSVGVSEDTVKYQIEKLIDKDQLGHFVVTFDYKKVGYDHHHYLIRLKDVEQSHIEELKKIDEISFINTSQGRYDLQLIIIHQSDEELMRVKETVDAILRGNIEEFLLLKFYRHFKYTNLIPLIDVVVEKPKNRKSPIYFLDEENWPAERTNLETNQFSQSEKKLIIELLKKPRASYVELAKKTKQSHEAVRQQMLNLVKEKVILNFGLMHDFQKHNLFSNYVFLDVEELDKNKFKQYVATKKNIFYSAELIGNYKVILYFLSENPSDLHKQMNELRKHFKSKLRNIELLSFEKVVKAVQCPIKALENNSSHMTSHLKLQKP